MISIYWNLKKIGLTGLCHLKYQEISWYLKMLFRRTDTRFTFCVKFPDFIDMQEGVR